MKYHTLRYFVCFSVVALVFTSCKTLNKDVTYEDMVRNASSHARKVWNEPDYETCKPDDRKTFDGVTLKNNLWGRSKLDQPESAVLCSFKQGESYSWKWELPNNASGVIGYPALQVGRNPFEKAASNVAEFPVKVGEIKHMPVNYAVETNVKHKKYNLSFDLWLTDKQDYALENIQTEIMVWEDYFDFTSYGKKTATIIAPFGTYEVFEGHLKNPKFSQDWQYIAFVRTTTRSEGEVDLAFFLEYLSKGGKISKEHYFTSIEFGNEIGNSSGYTLVKTFNWGLEKY